MTVSADDVVPNANSPQLLTQLLELVARGVRSSRGLQGALAVDSRTVRYYVRAGEWLRLIEPGTEVSLSPLGLEYVYAGNQRTRVYATAVWAVPLVRQIMAGHTDLPSPADVAATLLHAHPELAPSTAQRRASSVRSLIAPALKHRGGQARVVPQLDLPLTPTVRSLAPPTNMPDLAGEHDPALYRYLLGALLEFGELTLGHIRALLDRAGANDAPVGGYIAMASARGDASRVDNRLVLTAEAAAHGELAESTPAVILSDPGYRLWLDDLVRDDEVSAARRRSRAHRYAPWDTRLFGESPTPDTLHDLLSRRLIDRGIDTWPTRGTPGPAIDVRKRPFLELWEHAGLLVALPPSLGALRGGMGAVRSMFGETRHGERVGLPLPVEMSVATHAGLLHPGERPPRSIPDMRSLRMRLISRSPYPALFTALLLAHRGNPRIEIRRTRAGWTVCEGRRAIGGLLDVLDDFALSRNWICARRPRAGLVAQDLVDVLDVLGVLAPLSQRIVLDETFFVALRGEPEEMELRDQLTPLADAVEAYVTSVAS
jgi:hypothetical protein